MTANELYRALQDAFVGSGGQAYLGEELSVADHMLQAGQLAIDDGAPAALVLAALLHDYGYVVPPTELGDISACAHEELGAAYIARHLPTAVTEPIRLHVAAKRYLCGTEADYFECLSHASVVSLAAQGGPFAKHEACAFIVQPFARDAVRLRRYDDGAKVPGLVVSSLEAYRPHLDSLVGD